jgi:hypothetical protein
MKSAVPSVDVARKAVGDDDFREAVVDAVRLDVADEVEVAAAEQLVDLLRQLIALRRLLADVEQRDARVLDARDLFHIERAHLGELDKI